MSAPISHGRGGAANIRKDDTPYTDGSIVREGVEGDQGDGPYSSGRGGAANIKGAGKHVGTPADHETIPEVATRLEKEESYHIGRGGAGNTRHLHDAKHTPEEGEKKEGLGEKVKELLHLK